MKLQRQERAAMKDRIDWLKGWLKERNYDIKDERNDFLYVYYSTILEGLQCLPLWGRWRAEGVTEEVDLSHRKRSPLPKGEDFSPIPPPELRI